MRARTCCSGSPWPEERRRAYERAARAVGRIRGRGSRRPRCWPAGHASGGGGSRNRGGQSRAHGRPGQCAAPGAVAPCQTPQEPSLGPAAAGLGGRGSHGGEVGGGGAARPAWGACRVCRLPTGGPRTGPSAHPAGGRRPPGARGRGFAGGGSLPRGRGARYQCSAGRAGGGGHRVSAVRRCERRRRGPACGGARGRRGAVPGDHLLWGAHYRSRA